MSILSTSSKLVRVGDSYSAGEGISIENNVISVTGDYGHAYSAGDNITISDDHIISSKDWSSDIDTAVQNVSAETTAWVSEQGYITDADMSDYALITDVETTSGLLKMDIDTVSGSVSSKMDTTAFNDWQNGQYSNDIGGLANDVNAVSGAVDAISGAVSSLATKDEVSAYALTTTLEQVSGDIVGLIPSTAGLATETFVENVSGDITALIPDVSNFITNTSAETTYQPIGNYASASDITGFATKTELETTSGEIVGLIPSTAGLATTAQVDTASSFLSGAIDYVSANAGDEFPASANDAITAYQTYSGTYLTAHQSLSAYLTKSSADTLYQPIGSYASQTDLEQVSSDLKDDIDYISGVAITAHQDISNKLDTTAFSTVSGTFLTAVDLSNYYTKSETSGATELANAFANIPAGDADVNAYVQSNSSTINDVNSTVQSNSAQWGEGTSVDTIPVAVISPLVTGFSGESAYLGIESTALNLSSYVPVSAIGVNNDDCISGISGKQISARYAYTTYTANNAQYAYRANQDSNYNTITSYYQPKLTITGDAGTITSINGSAVGANIPEGWELVAGQGIEIVDDAENNQTTISVSGLSATEWNDVYDTVQTNSGSWIGGGGGGGGDMSASLLEGNDTSWQGDASTDNSLTGYNGSAFGLGSFYVSDYDSIKKNDGDAIIEINNVGISFRNPEGGLSEQDADYNGSYWRISQENSTVQLEGYKDEIIFTDANNHTESIYISSVSGWNDVSATVQSNSSNWGGGNPEVESYVQTNSASIDDTVSTYQSNSGSYLTQETDWTNIITAASSYAYSEAVAQIPAPFDPTYMSGAIDQNVRDIQYISGVAITAHQDISNKLDTTAFSDVSGTFLTAVDLSNYYQKNETSGATELAYAFANSKTDLELVSGDLNDLIDYMNQDISNKLDTTAFSTVSGTFLTAVNIPESANWNDATTAYQTNSASYMTEPNLEYNAVNEISAYNGSAIAQYGAEKQWLVHDDTLVHAANSAQYALGVNLSAVAQLLGVDETVLWDNTNGYFSATNSTGHFAYPLSAFEAIEFRCRVDNIAEQRIRFTTPSYFTKNLTVSWQEFYQNYRLYFLTLRTDGNSFTGVSNCMLTTNGTVNQNLTVAQSNWQYGYVGLQKIIGIGRKS